MAGSTRMPDLRENALAVGARLFGAKGYAATTTRELTAALGTTNGNFYHHFETKEQLLFEICKETLERITAAARAGIAGAEDPRQRLETLIRVHVHTMLADQGMHATMLIELRSLSGERLEAVRALRDGYGTLVKDVIRECQGASVIKRDATPEALALILLNMLNWTIFWWRSDGPLSPDAFADLIAATFLNGACTRS